MSAEAQAEAQRAPLSPVAALEGWCRARAGSEGLTALTLRKPLLSKCEQHEK